ncbi:MAG TPA: hypothetical protein VHD76_14595 [Bryobacteraceae bacterium]|nr:hypothetical protein [Bryobacteraceae bacterium]
MSAGLVLLVALSAHAAPAVKQFPLDERVVYEIPISGDAPTTLMFPSSLTAIEAANVSANPETPAPVLLAYTPGRTFFSVRALEPAAKAAVNVVWKNKTYVLRFFVNAESYGSVTFYEDDLAGRSAALHRRVTLETLLGLLDRAKSFALVSAQYPEAVQQIERATPESVTYYRDFRVTVEEVFRFDPEDTLVFRLRFENTGESEVVYQPQRLAARVGQNVYYASIADASGIVPPKATTTGFFAVSGTPRGGRANLSVKNLFTVVVPRVERDAKLIAPQ